MDLLRTWRREALRATGVGLLAPGAIILALALAAAGGGLGGVGSLGQLVSGPDVPAGEVAAGAGSGGLTFARGSGVLPPLPRTAPASRRRVTSGGAGRRRAGGSPGSSRPNRPGAPPGRTAAPPSAAGRGAVAEPARPAPVAPTQSPGPPAAPATASPSPPPPPPATPSAAPSRGGLVQGAVDAINGLLHPLVP